MISNNFKKRISTAIALLISVLLMFKFYTILLFSLIVLGVLSLLEFIALSKKIFQNKLYLFFFNISFIIFIFSYCFMFFFFSSIMQLKIIMFTLLLGCIFSDLGGFIFGKIFKGPKLTKISPNKTIIGAAGSLLMSSSIITIIAFYFTDNFNYKIFVIGLVTSISCQIGDLFFSYIKRKAKVKDTGNFLPGHGGILDRLDGIFFGIPLGFIALLLLY
jgi:phosphatidate cytidylyltransferase